MKKAQKTQKEVEVLYGAHAIIEMLKAKKRKLYSIYTTKPLPKSWERIEKFLPQRIPNIQYVSRNALDGMAHSTEHMGIVALVSPFPFSKKMFSPEKHPFIVMLDSIQDVRNVGGILRSAYCTDASGIVMCKSNAAQLTSDVFKTSAGLAEHLNVYVAPSAKSASLELKAAGYNIYMAAIDGKPVNEVEFKFPLCLVIGNEFTGIKGDVKKLGTSISIPQRDNQSSYNASVAAGILMFLAYSATLKK